MICLHEIQKRNLKYFFLYIHNYTITFFLRWLFAFFAHICLLWLTHPKELVARSGKRHIRIIMKDDLLFDTD